VDDLAEIYRQARLVVVPLLAGGGTNIKVLEALTYGRPCLVTQFVANAFVGHLAAGKEILVAGDAAEFAKAICAALLPGAQPELQRLALAGRTAVEMSFTPASFKEHVANFAQTLLAAAHRKDVVS
jgi:glycosyltransferase involved in cell wall biosynthesis